MSTESLALRTEVPAPVLASPSTAAPVAAPPLAQGAKPADAVTTPQSLQERRLRVARELDMRINGLEQDIRKMGDSLAQSRLAATTDLRELQQRSSSLTTELLRVGARLAQQGSAQEKNARQLEHRLGGRLQDIERTLAALTTGLRTQTEGQYELQQRHDTLTRLHEHLDRIVNRQGRNLDILSAEFQQRIELLRISFEGLQEIFFAQQESLLGLALEHEQQALLTRQLQARLGEIGARLDTHVDQTHQRLRPQMRWLAASTLFSLGLITYCQFNPVAVPANVSGQLATMAGSLANQKAQATTLTAQGRLQDERLASLTAALEAERHETRRLRQGVRRANSRLAKLDRQLAEIHPAPAPITSATMETRPAAPQQTTATAGILLPPALSGSRPDF